MQNTKPGALLAVEVLQWVSAGIGALGCVTAIVGAEFAVAAWNAFIGGLYAFVAYKLRRGSEGARTLLLLTSYVSLAYAAFLSLFCVVLFADARLPQIIGGVILLSLVAWVGGQAVFTIRTLKRPDVQQWMFDRSLGEV
jgi:hypothetical protein